MQAKPYFHLGPYAEAPEWGAPPAPVGLIVPAELVADWSVPHDAQDFE